MRGDRAMAPRWTCDHIAPQSLTHACERAPGPTGSLQPAKIPSLKWGPLEAAKPGCLTGRLTNSRDSRIRNIRRGYVFGRDLVVIWSRVGRGLVAGPNWSNWSNWKMERAEMDNRGNGNSERLRWVRWLDLSLILLYCTVGAAILFTLPSENALANAKRLKRKYSALVPEGWAFFTRSATEKRVHTYRQDAAGRFYSLDSSDIRGFGVLGINRYSRTAGMALADITTRIAKDAWTDCEGSVRECLPKVKTTVKIASRMRVTPLCGRLIVREVEPVPWGWRASYQRVRLPSRIAKVDVTCGSRVRAYR